MIDKKSNYYAFGINITLYNSVNGNGRGL